MFGGRVQARAHLPALLVRQKPLECYAWRAAEVRDNVQNTPAHRGPRRAKGHRQLLGERMHCDRDAVNDMWAGTRCLLAPLEDLGGVVKR